MDAPAQTPPPFPPTQQSVVDALAPEAVRQRRLAALVVFLAAGVVLATGWLLAPAKAGFGTHQALGLPACTWPQRFGVPCPSCGMTTSFAYATKGRLIESFTAQPMGCLLAIATGMAFVGSAWSLVSGRTVWPVYERLWSARVGWLLAIAALLAWGYKAAAMRGWLG